MIATAAHLHRLKHFVFDEPQRWASPGIWKAPHFNVAEYQKKLGRIVGTSDGKPIIRLKWSWDCREFFYTAWDEFGNPTESAMRQKYRFMTVKLPDGDEVDIAPPRWILEERFEPGQYIASWDATRYVFDPALGRRKDLRGNAPPEWYNALPEVGIIASHDPDKSCCERAFNESRRRCWGYYRLPNAKDLRSIERAVYERNLDPFRQSPHQPLSPETLEEAHRQASMEAETVETERSQLISDLWDDQFLVHGHRLTTDDPGVLKHGKYHFTKTNSGLVLPQEIL